MKFISTLIRALLPVYLILLLGACAVVPKDLDSQGQDDGQVFSRKVVALNDSVLSSHDGVPIVMGSDESHSFYQTTFVRGDILRLTIVGMDQYSGLYKVTSEGKLDLPFTISLTVTNLSRQALIDKIESELVRLKWFYKESVDVDLSLVQFAPINVSVTGAVFNPGRVVIDGQPITKPEDNVQQLAGAFSTQRNLESALGAAGGVRPDANISEVFIKRGNTILVVSMSSLIDGDGYMETPMLTNGDQVLVRSTGIIDPELIKPSQITPPGMRVFMSNLTSPALNNAQSAVGSDSTRLPYGSSLLDSVISANCIGGTHQANASRSVLMVTRNLGSNQQLIVRRSINQLLANSSNQLVNPFMMPNDGIACYDSRFTNFRDVARGVGELISPILLGRFL